MTGKGSEIKIFADVICTLPQSASSLCKLKLQKTKGRSRTLYVHTEVFLCFKRILKTLSAIEAKLDLK